MTDTAQLAPLAAENVAIDTVADAFKAHIALNEAPETPVVRNERGQFASTAQPEAEEEIEAHAEPVEGEDEANVDADNVETDEAADEAQLEAVEMPASWSKEDAETWSALPAEAQAKIAEREAQRDQAVNLKFQEAANVRKANEAIVNEANANRDRYVEAIDFVTSLIQPQKPSLSMLNPQSSDYNPDAYHFANGQYEQQIGLINDFAQQRQYLTAQQVREAEQAEQAAIAEIESFARPAFLKDVPELTDPAKAPGAMNELVSYAIKHGIPEHVFTDPETQKSLTSAQLHIVWKAKEYDRLQAAKARVTATSKPQPKPAQPALRAGVTTPRAAIEQGKVKGAMARLASSGSIEDGAAVMKHLFKGI